MVRTPPPHLGLSAAARPHHGRTRLGRLPCPRSPGHSHRGHRLLRRADPAGTPASPPASLLPRRPGGPVERAAPARARGRPWAPGHPPRVVLGTDRGGGPHTRPGAARARPPRQRGMYRLRRPPPPAVLRGAGAAAGKRGRRGQCPGEPHWSAECRVAAGGPPPESPPVSAAPRCSGWISRGRCRALSEVRAHTLPVRRSGPRSRL